MGIGLDLENSVFKFRTPGHRTFALKLIPQGTKYVPGEDESEELAGRAEPSSAPLEGRVPTVPLREASGGKPRIRGQGPAAIIGCLCRNGVYRGCLLESFFARDAAILRREDGSFYRSGDEVLHFQTSEGED